VDSAFTIFYMGINLGAFIAPLLCGYLGDTGNPEDFRWGFLAACMGMILSLVLFISLKNKYIVTPEGEQIGVAPNSARQANDGEAAPVDSKSLLIWGGVFLATLLGFKYYAEMDWVGSFIFSLTIAAPGYIIGDSSLSTIERQRIWVIYVAAFFVIFFWAAFEQAGASLTYFAEEQTNREFMGSTIPTSYFQSINAVAIVIFAPIFVWIWGWLGKRNMEPASPFKQSLGLFLLALGYLVIAMGVKGLEPGVKVSMMWLVSLYTIHTFGELCLSPIGLSMVNKLAPVKFASLLMGVWFLSTAAANKFAGTLSALYPEPVVSVQALESMQADMASKGNTVTLLPENFNSEEAAAIDGQKVIPLEKVNLAGIEDETVKAETKLAVEQNLIDNPKTFLGFTILTLYDFFMLFVFMAGASAVFLFVLSKRLLVMMNGVR